MQTSADDDGVFVRSLSSRGQFGGLSAEVWPMCLVMLAAFDIVLIETVGVGQREVDISRMCDTTCYVAQPGSGDSVQFLKAGILEVPHILVVNKEDMGAVARRTQAELATALVREHPDGHWEVPVLATSATNSKGIDALADTLDRHLQALRASGQLVARRHSYQAYWIHKRLLEEFGTFGIAQLGGESCLLTRLQSQPQNLLQQYETLRQQLLTLYSRAD
jgi:LAO/AO transport system kinase